MQAPTLLTLIPKRGTALIGQFQHATTLAQASHSGEDQLSGSGKGSPARAQLDEATYARAYAAGYAMTPDQAVALALAQFGALA